MNYEFVMRLTVVFINTLCNIIVTFRGIIPHRTVSSFVLGWAKMRIDDMNDAQDLYEFEEDAMGENFRLGNDETESNGRIFQDTPPDFAATMKSLRVDLQSCREDNERTLKAQEDQNQINAAIL